MAAALGLCGLLGALTGDAAADGVADAGTALLARAHAEADTLRRRGYTIADDSLEARLQGMVNRLVAGAPVPAGVAPRVRVLRSPEPSAFTLPDGSMLVFAGLLAELTDLDQLAFVLRHEAEHALGRDAGKRLEARSPPAIAATAASTGPAAVADSSLAGDRLARGFTSLGLGLAATSATSGYGSDLEYQADRVAAQRLEPAGYDACGANRALEVLARNARGSASTAPFLWEDRSALEPRIAALRERSGRSACGLDSTHVAPDYYAIKWPMTKLSARLWLAAGEPRKAIRLARRYLEIYPADAEIHRMMGDAYVASAAPESLGLANQSYMLALSLGARDDRSPLRGLARVAEMRGDTAACVRYLERYLAGNAPVPDRGELSIKLETLRSRAAAGASRDSARVAPPRPAPRRK